MAVTQAHRDWIWKLRQTGATVRKIAEITGLSRSAVCRVLAEGPDPIPASGPIGRCPRCGRLVRLPCLACFLEQAPQKKKRVWKASFRRLEGMTMDLVKELTELKKAIQDALEDGRIKPMEAIRIAKEAADVLEIVTAIICGQIDAELKTRSAKSDAKIEVEVERGPSGQ